MDGRGCLGCKRGQPFLHRRVRAVYPGRADADGGQISRGQSRACQCVPGHSVQIGLRIFYPYAVPVGGASLTPPQHPAFLVHHHRNGLCPAAVNAQYNRSVHYFTRREFNRKDTKKIKRSFTQIQSVKSAPSAKSAFLFSLSSLWPVAPGQNYALA